MFTMKKIPIVASCFLLLLLLTHSSKVHAQINAMTGAVTYENILQPSFENPAPWTFSGAAGALNNPNAPSGNKVLYIRGQSSASQSITISGKGCFRFDIQAAQAGSTGNNGFRIWIDTLEVLEIQPPGTGFAQHYSVAFTLEPGTHTIKIEGVVSTAFAVLLDDIQLARLPCWSDQNIWSQGSVPDNADTVMVADDKFLVLDTIATCHSLRSMGQVLAANNLPLSLDANIIMLMKENALMEWGQVNTPYEENGVITLKGNIGLAQADLQTAALMADSARLQLHGQVRDSWVQLGKHANQGDTEITLETAVDWRIGDLIVIASTDFDPHQAETRVITDTSNNGMTFHFVDKLDYNHFGELQVFPNSPTITDLDQRAEVGLLSRNLKIQGDSDAHLDKAGGHIMVMKGSFAQVSGVELFQMGQEGILGRYPFHWHLTGDLTDQYIKNSSIHVSFNRVLTVHSSQNGLIEDNVAYDHIGNGYFLENGDETNNQFIHNLGILTRLAQPGKEVRKYDRLAAIGVPLFRLPATFWITHPTNDFIDNASAGSEASGFWMTVQHAPIEFDTAGIEPRKEPLGQFEGNSSHSNGFSNFAIDLRVVEDSSEPTGHNIIESGNYLPPNTPLITKFTSYKCQDRAIWMRTNSLDFEGCASADNGRSTFFSYHNVIRNSLFVGKSDNVGTPSEWSANDSLANRSLPFPQSPITSLGNHFRGHLLYDGPSGVENCHFANFTGINATVFSPNTAATKSTVHFARQLSFTNVDTSNKFSSIFDKDRDYQWTTGLLTHDSSIDPRLSDGDFVKPRIFPDNNPDRRLYDEGFNVEVGAEYIPEWEHYICRDEHYALLIMENDLDPSRKNPMYSIRSDGPATITAGQSNQNQIPVIVNNPDYRYYLQYHRIPDLLHFKLRFGSQNDSVTFVLLNIPSNSTIRKPGGGSIMEFASLADFESNITEGYFLKNNTLYIRLVATNILNTKQFGDEFKYTSEVQVCQYGGCQNITDAGTFDVPIADYENEKDERATLSTSGNLPLSVINNVNGQDTFNIVSDGDGIDEYIEYRLGFHRQAWSEFNNMEINYEGPEIEVLIHDQGSGNILLGHYQSTTCDGLDLTRLSKEEVDEVDAVIIRVRESTLGSLDQTGLIASIKLDDIRLDHSRDLWDFHRDTEGWGDQADATIEVINNGLLSYSQTSGSAYMQNSLFFGMPSVNINANTSVALRVKPITAVLNKGTFRHFAWGGGWVAEPDYTFTALGQFNHIIINPTWPANLDLQRVRFDLIKGPSATLEVDYIRFTDCPMCYDSLQNGNETGIDCGGPDCMVCPCENGMQDNGETGIDCGGTCQPCSQLVLETGKVTGVSDTWLTVSTTNTYNNMVVVATPEVVNSNSNPVVCRIQNISPTSFQLKLQNPGDGSSVGNHTVHYVVVEEGIYTDSIDGVTMEAWSSISNSTAGTGNWVFENHTLSNNYTNPVVLGQVQSYNDARWSTFWASKMDVRVDPPASGMLFSGGKHVAQDIQGTRANETIGFIAIEKGLYQLNGQLLQAGVGQDKILGIENATTPSQSSYSLSPQLKIKGAVLSSAAMDGGDGGWPVLFTSTPFVNNKLYLAIDEDQILDAERLHTTEQVAYLAFGTHALIYQVGNPISYPAPLKGNPGTQIAMYPNPATEGQTIILQSGEEGAIDLAELTIIAADGRAVPFYKEAESPHQIRIDAKLAAGVYFVHVSGQGIRTVKKLVIHKN